MCVASVSMFFAMGILGTRHFATDRQSGEIFYGPLPLFRSLKELLVYISSPSSDGRFFMPAVFFLYAG